MPIEEIINSAAFQLVMQSVGKLIGWGSITINFQGGKITTKSINIVVK